MKFHLTIASGNSKTGAIPVSTSSAETCPSACPLKANGCYAAGGPLFMHWQKVTEGKRGTTWEIFLSFVKALPRGTLWRHNQAGDLAGDDNTIDGEMLDELVKANRGKRGFTYTHKPMTPENQKLVEQANKHRFVINLSADNIAEADELADLGIAPVVTVLPDDTEGPLLTPGGRTIVICPAQTHHVTCATCQLCSVGDRKSIVGFLAHGYAKKKVSKLAQGG